MRGHYPRCGTQRHGVGGRAARRGELEGWMEAWKRRLPPLAPHRSRDAGAARETYTSALDLDALGTPPRCPQTGTDFFVAFARRSTLLRADRLGPPRRRHRQLAPRVDDRQPRRSKGGRRRHHHDGRGHCQHREAASAAIPRVDDSSPPRRAATRTLRRRNGPRCSPATPGKVRAVPEAAGGSETGGRGLGCRARFASTQSRFSRR